MKKLITLFLLLIFVLCLYPTPISSQGISIGSGASSRFRKLQSDPPVSGSGGEVYFNLNNSVFKFNDGTQWITLPTDFSSFADVVSGAGITGRIAVYSSATTLTSDSGLNYVGTGSTFALFNAGKYFVANGAINSPTFSFTGNNTTGFYSGGSSTTAFIGESLNGIEAWRSVGGATTSLNLFTGLGLGGLSTPNTFIFGESANTLSLRNSTTAQRFNIGNTFTSTSNREDLSLYFLSNIAHIGNTTTGGTARVLQLDYGGTTTSAISIPITSGTLTFGGGINSPTYSTATNCSDSAGTAACGSAASGSFVIDAASTSTVVSTTSVTANSQIFIQDDSSLGTRLSVTCNTTAVLPTVTARTGGTSFTVTVAAAPITNPLCLSYHIVN